MALVLCKSHRSPSIFWEARLWLEWVFFFGGKKIKPGSQADHFKKKIPQIWMTKNSLHKDSRLRGRRHQLNKWVRSKDLGHRCSFIRGIFGGILHFDVTSWGICFFFGCLDWLLWVLRIRKNQRKRRPFFSRKRNPKKDPTAIKNQELYIYIFQLTITNLWPEFKVADLFPKKNILAFPARRRSFSFRC